MKNNLSLYEILKSQEILILLEDYRLDKIKQIVNKRLTTDEKLTEEEINTIVQADPTSREGSAGKYSEWLIKQYINSDASYRSRFFEDLYKYTEALSIFHEKKLRNKIKKNDINAIKDLWELQDIIQDEEEKYTQLGFPDTKQLEASGEVEVVLRDTKMCIYWTKTHRANTILGTGTQWCTVPKSSSYFDEYNKQGPLFILFVRESDKIIRFQYHFESEQFMDEKDSDDASYLKNSKVKNAFINFARKYKSGSIAVYYKDTELLKDKEIQLSAVKQDRRTIKYIENPSERVQLAAVKQNGYTIQYIKNPSERVQLAAVQQYGRTIKYIKNPSERVQLAAVEQDGYAIVHIKNPTEEIQLAAVKQNGRAIQYIKNPSEEIQLLAVQQYGYTIEYIKNPSEEIQLAAIKQNAYAIEYIKNPSERVKQLYKQLYKK
jgi:hypothetical protein